VDLIAGIGVFQKLLDLFD